MEHAQNITNFMNLMEGIVDFSYVRYDHEDPIALLFAYFTLVPCFLMPCLMAVVVARRELRTISFLLGLMGCYVVLSTLKKALRHPRPITCAAVDACNSHGMPSIHTGLMCFFTFYTMLFLVKRAHLPLRWSLAWSFLILWPTSAMVGTSRIYLGYHSLEQVLCGFALGSLVSLIWWVVTEKVLVPIFPAIESWSICRYLLIKDSSHVPGVVEFEYKNSVNVRPSKRSSRSGKAKTK
eukprot:jgi/Mesvir1/21288/Mv21681-RA.1